LIPFAVLVLAVSAGLGLVEGRGGPLSADARASRLDAQAEEFVRLALALAQHEPAEVDAYFGPDSLRPAPNAPRIPLVELLRRAHYLTGGLDHLGDRTHDGRLTRLFAQARALTMAIDRRMSGTHASFDDEARDVYGMALDERDSEPGPGREPGAIDEALAALERALPGDGPLAARFAAYRARFAVPSDRRRALFAAALDGCRSRTLAHWPLPADERFEVKWQIGAPGAWHRYEGRRHSTLTINPGAVEFIDTAIDLACHEGYPGHHAQFLLAEGNLAGSGAVTGSNANAGGGSGAGAGANGRVEAAVATSASGSRAASGASIVPSASALPIEDTIALLRSPVSMLREGAAQYAVDLAFPADDRLRFERDVLFPIAGFAPADAARYFEIRQLVRTLEPAIVPILRDYRDGRLSPAQAAARLETRALVSSPQSLLRFVDDLGPYVLGYTVARDRVATHVARELRTTSHADPWTSLRVLLAPPDISVLHGQAIRRPSTTD
jgi:hypothetical protein